MKKKIKVFVLRFMFSVIYVFIIRFILRMIFDFDGISSSHFGGMVAAVFLYVNMFPFSKIVIKRDM